MLCKRKGIIGNLNPGELVVGDILKIEPGKTIPVDGLLIVGKEVMADESSMTGESHELKKATLIECLNRIQDLAKEKEVVTEMNVHTIPSPVILSGTKITQGDGLFLSICVGERSAIGKIREKIMKKPEPSPLQMKLEAIAEDIGKVGFYVAILTVAVMLIRFFITRFVNGGWTGTDASTCLSFIMIGITIFAVAIPEGLPLAVTISLAYSVSKMYDEKNFVKSLMSCEVMGGATTICTDKTGTLTENKMRVLRYFINSKENFINEKLDQYTWESDITEEQKQLIIESLCSNSTASATHGNPTEKALLDMITKFGIDAEAKKSSC